MWNRYALPVVGGLAALSLGLNYYEMYHLLHPQTSFHPTVLRFNATHLSQRLQASPSTIAHDLSKPPSNLYTLTPILPIDSINAYVQKSEADLLVLDFSEVDLNDDHLFQYVYSKMRNPPPIAECRKDGKETEEPMCHLLFSKMLDHLRLRAAKHIPLPEMQWYESPVLLTYYYTFRYGEEAYQDVLAKPRFPVIVLKNTEKWKESNPKEMKKLLDLYVGLLRLAGTAHIFIEASPGTDNVLKELDKQVPRRPKTSKEPKEPPSD